MFYSGVVKMKPVVTNQAQNRAGRKKNNNETKPLYTSRDRQESSTMTKCTHAETQTRNIGNKIYKKTVKKRFEKYKNKRKVGTTLEGWKNEHMRVCCHTQYCQLLQPA